MINRECKTLIRRNRPLGKYAIMNSRFRVVVSVEFVCA